MFGKVNIPENWMRIKQVFRLATPLILAMLIQNLVNGVDMFLIGLLPNEYSIPGHASISPAMTIFWALGGFASAISVGTQAMVARRYGETDSRGAGRVLFNSLVLATVVGSVISIGAALFARPLFSLFTSNEHVLAVGVPFARVRFLGIIFLVGTMSLKSFFDGIGRTYYYLISVVLMNIVNAFLSYMFIFGLWFIPPFYVTGAAIGSAISSGIGFVILLLFVAKKRYRDEYQIFTLKNFSFRIIFSIAKLSLPSGISTIVVMTGFFFFLKWVAVLDITSFSAIREGLPTAKYEWLHAIVPFAAPKDDFISIIRAHPPINGAASSVIITVVMFSVMACMGIGIASATLVSQNLGRNEPREAERYAWTAVGVAVVITGTLGMIGVLFPDFLMGIITKDLEVIDAGRTAMRIIGASEFLFGAGIVLAQSLFGAGNTKFVMWVELILHTGCLIPLSYLLGVTAGLGISGVWLSATVYALSLAVIMAIKFRSGGWKRIKI